ncbi:hypothetical protein IRY61_02815 [Candidatus Saccharibacteria bacterium]|nr:hypothetical protein [Candidatus Saccharibacteria bacterium]
MRQTSSANHDPGVGFVSAYIQHIGSKERRRTYEPLSPEHPMHASYFIGRSCLLLTTGDDRVADRLLRRVRDAMHPRTEDSKTRVEFDTEAAFGAHLFYIAMMLLDRDSRQAPDEFRIAAHSQAIEELRRIKHTMRALPKRRNELLGRRSEQQGISLLTRPGVIDMVTQALPHHDRGIDPKKNYDILGINGDDWLPHQAQLKDYCLNFEDGRQGRNKGLHERRKYREDIVLISGHCDIHHGRPDILSEWLIDEAEGKASPEIVETLDARTAALAKALVMPEPWRMGTTPLRAAGVDASP